MRWQIDGAVFMVRGCDSRFMAKDVSGETPQAHNDKRDSIVLFANTKNTRIDKVSLKPDHFEGMRSDFTRMLNQKFSLNHKQVRDAIPRKKEQQHSFNRTIEDT